MTGYVVTRWYRAPEVILSWMRYNQTGQWSAAPGSGLGVFSEPVTSFKLPYQV